MTSRKFIILLFCLALVSGIFWGVNYSKDPGDDALGYDQNALLTLENGVFFKGAQISDRPLYPIFLAGIYKVFGHNYWAVRIIQIFLFIFSCFLVYWLCQMIFNEKIARLASLIMALCYSIASYTGLLLRGVFLLFLVVLLIYCLYRAQLSYKNIWFILSGIVMGLAILTNMVLQFLPLLIMLNFLIIGWKLGLKKIYPKIIMFFLAFLLIITPWLITNFIYFDHLPFSSGGGLHLASKVEKMENIEGKYTQHLVGNTLGDFFAQKWYPNYNRKEARLGWQAFQEYHAWNIQGKDQTIIDNIMITEAKQKILKHPIMFLKITSIDFLKFNTPMIPNVRMQHMFAETHPELSDFTKASIILIIRFFYLIFFALIIYAIVKNIKNWQKMSWLFIIILYFNIIYSLIHAIARYSLPIYPFYIILFTLGVLAIGQRLSIKSFNTSL